MSIIKKSALAVVLVSINCVAAAAEFRPAVSYDPAGKIDKSFNQAVYENGVKKFRADTGITIKEFAPSSDQLRLRGLESLAERGFSPIVVVGFSYNDALNQVAPRYPDTDFVIIDSVVNQPNVKSLVFAEHEGSFIVGAIAAMKSQSNTVGFIGGMDIPFIRKFGCGFEQGVHFVNPNTKVISDMTGDTPAAFADPVRGEQIAIGQIEQGVDVIYAAAGSTGNGVYQAAKMNHKYAIGVDSNQNMLVPGTMLTSMVKRVGFATYNIFKDYQAGVFEPGIQPNSLANNGITWALDRYNRDLISAEDEAAVNRIIGQIIAGEIVVHDYTTNNNCGADSEAVELQ